MPQTSHRQYRDQSGSIIIFTLLLLGVMLAITLTLTSIFVPKITLSAKAKSSTGALYAADSAIEWCLYVAQVDDTAAAPVMSNGAIYSKNDSAESTLDPSYCQSSPLKVIGSYQGVSRALELNF